MKPEHWKLLSPIALTRVMKRRGLDVRRGLYFTGPQHDCQQRGVLTFVCYTNILGNSVSLLSNCVCNLLFECCGKAQLVVIVNVEPLHASSY